ncbi:MAG: penicillin-binding protein [Acidobacteriota bacterium]
MLSATKTSERRSKIVHSFLAFWLIAICARLVWLQVKDYNFLSARADRQQRISVAITPTRGKILDRNDTELACTSEVKSLYVNPSLVGDLKPVAARLGKILNKETDDIFKRLKSADNALVVIKRNLNDTEVSQLEALNLNGLQFIPERKRFYLNGQTAAHILGFVDVDENGLSGIERFYDKQIRGQDGRLVINRDALKRSYSHNIEESIPGANIKLTIDAMVQHYAEIALAEGIRKSRAKGGTLVMMRPQTGEILAMASYPTFDPNKLASSDAEDRRNRAVETYFEPGSIFKIVPYAGALEEKLIRPDTRIYCGNGQITIAGRVIHDNNYGELSAAQALAKSSNVAAIKIGQQLGNERLAHYIDAFGFGKKTNVELPAESRGAIRDVKKWNATSIGSIPMGHEIGVTAVQAVAAFACIANGGVWVQPHLVQSITDASGAIISEPQIETRRVISQQTAETLKFMLEGVVLRGTARAAQLEGYSVAGKTGTAQKVGKNGRYSNEKYVASFAGFAPVANPEIVCIVSIDEPLGEHHGGEVAAPIFARAISHALNVLGISPENDPAAKFVAGNYQTYDINQMSAGNVPVVAENTTGEEISEPAPTKSPEMASNAEVVKTEINKTNKDKPASRDTIVVPDMRGRGLREAMAMASTRGLKIQASGEGLITSQSPPAGSYVSRAAICRVQLTKAADKNSRTPSNKNKSPTVKAQTKPAASPPNKQPNKSASRAVAKTR